MPPGQVPRDRRYLEESEKKEGRRSVYSDGLGSGGTSSTSFRSRERSHGDRDFCALSPRPPMSGHHKHSVSGGGSHNPISDEAGRSEDDGFRASRSFGHADGRNWTTFRRDYRRCAQRSSWDPGYLSGQQDDSIASAQRSVADPLSHPSSNPLPFNDQNKNAGDSVDDGLRTGLGYDRERDHSLGSFDWKSRKWSRSVSFSSSPKVSVHGSDERKRELQSPIGKEMLAGTPAVPPLPLDEGLPHKKQRLGWGQGLAKYEKKKFEDPEDGKNVSVHCSSSAKSILGDSSPKIIALPESVSPVTLSSSACSSFQGMEIRHCSKEASVEATCSLFASPGHVFQHLLEKFSINSENLDLDSLSALKSVMADSLCLDNSCSVDSHFTGQPTMSQLLLLKRAISKQLEKIESAIDLSENERKKLNFESERIDHSPKSSKMQDNGLTQQSGELVAEVSSHSTSMVPSRDTSLGWNDLPFEQKKVAKGRDSRAPDAVDCKLFHTELVEKEASENDSLRAADVGGASSFTSDADQPSVVIVNAPALGNKNASKKYDQEHSDAVALIMDCNRDSARRASELLHSASSKIVTNPSFSNICESKDALPLPNKRVELCIRQKLAIRKCSLRFKERILSLKYRALWHLWKEDLQSLSMRKHSSKSHNRLELKCQQSQGGSKKSRSSPSARFPLSGNSAPVPAMEALDFMGGAAALLANSRPKIYRAELRMPALILDEDDRIRSRFMTSNGRVEDPCSLEKERTMINPWSAEERETFMRMLSLFGKDFAKIASSIAHKTTADCVEFYYKNHKSESFREVRRSLCLRKQQQQQQKGMTAAAAPARSYLLMSGRRLKPASALDMLVMPPMRGTGLQQKPRRGVRKSTPEDVAAAAATKDYEALAAAAAAVPPSSEAVSSCVTTSLDTARMDRQVFDEGACSDEGCSEAGTADWTDEEKCRFVAAVSCSGRDFAGISLRVGTRSEEQCRVFFSKARKSLGLDRLTPLPPPPPPPMAGDQSGNSGSGGEPDDGCVVEIDSAPAGGVPPGQERGAIQDERDWHKAGGDRRQNVDIKLFGQILQRQRVPMRGDGTPRGPDDALSQYSRPKPADR